MKSKFLYQDVDVVSLADKGIVVRCFVCKNNDKVLMETGKFCDNIRVIKNGLVSGVDRMFKSSDSAFKHITDRLNPLRKSVEFDIFFLRPPSGVRFRYTAVVFILGNTNTARICWFDRGKESSHIWIVDYERDRLQSNRSYMSISLLQYIP